MSKENLVAHERLARGFYELLPGLRKAVAQAPSAEAWQAVGRLSAFCAGFASQGDVILPEAIEAFEFALARTNKTDRLLWADIKLDHAEALLSLSIYPFVSQDDIFKVVLESVQGVLDQAASPTEPELWSRANFLLGRTLLMISSRRSASEAAALRKQAEAAFVSATENQEMSDPHCHLSALQELGHLRSSVGDASGAEKAFEAGVRLAESWADQGFAREYVDAQCTLGHHFLKLSEETKDPKLASRAAAVFRQALTAVGSGPDPEWKLVRSILQRNLQRAKQMDAGEE